MKAAKVTAPAANSRTAPFRLTVEPDRMSAGISRDIPPIPATASARPNTPPSTARTKLSVSIWLMMRLRLAPRAMRNATSLERLAPRSNTNMTAPKSTRIAGLMLLTNASRIGWSATPNRSLLDGYSVASRAAMPSISARAFVRLTPLASLPITTKSPRAPRSLASSELSLAHTPIGNITSVLSSER